jgi:hypothetical protein
MKIVGTEWENLTTEQINDAQQNFDNTFAADPAYLKFMIVGKRPVKRLLSVEGAKGLKIKMGLVTNEDTGALQMFPILVAVDKHGTELPAPEGVEFDDDQDEEAGMAQIMDDPTVPPVRCPASCS